MPKKENRRFLRVITADYDEVIQYEPLVARNSKETKEGKHQQAQQSGKLVHKNRAGNDAPFTPDWYHLEACSNPDGMS